MADRLPDRNDLVFGALEVLAGLLADFLEVLLLFVELVDELVLVGNLVVQVSDLVILGGLVLFGLIAIEIAIKIFELMIY